jgi:uncharacterized protein (DUF849 family)
MTTTIETDLKEILGDFKQEFSKINQRLDIIQKELTDLKVSQQRDIAELRGDMAELRSSQQQDSAAMKISQADIRGDIKTLDEKVTGLGKRLDNQEFLNRGVLTALIVALVAGAAKLFGWLPTA